MGPWRTLIDGMNIVWIRSLSNTYCKKFSTFNHSHISSAPKKGCSFAQGFHLLYSLPTGWILCIGIHTHNSAMKLNLPEPWWNRIFYSTLCPTKHSGGAIICRKNIYIFCSHFFSILRVNISCAILFIFTFVCSQLS